MTIKKIGDYPGLKNLKIISHRTPAKKKEYVIRKWENYVSLTVAPEVGKMTLARRSQ